MGNIFKRKSSEIENTQDNGDNDNGDNVDDDNVKCIICCSNERDTVMFPCGHLLG